MPFLLRVIRYSSGAGQAEPDLRLHSNPGDAREPNPGGRMSCRGHQQQRSGGAAPRCKTPRNFHDILWPPNHKMLDVLIETHVTDNGGGAVTLSVDQITSTEAPDKDKNGQTIPDWKVIGIDQQTGAVNLQLRSERSGNGPGRTYTITISATDSSGNWTTSDLQVQAPHDMR